MSSGSDFSCMPLKCSSDLLPATGYGLTSRSFITEASDSPCSEKITVMTCSKCLIEKSSYSFDVNMALYVSQQYLSSNYLDGHYAFIVCYH